MAFPKKDEIELPILLELNALGGQGTTQEIYRRVAKHFPQMSSDEQMEKLRSGDKKWPNLVRWARLKLLTNGEVAGSGKGMWIITDKGKQRIEKKS